MTADFWEPTVRLRWSKEGRLQQLWRQMKVEWRLYGGQERHCEVWEERWEDIPTEPQPGSPDA